MALFGWIIRSAIACAPSDRLLKDSHKRGQSIHPAKAGQTASEPTELNAIRILKGRPVFSALPVPKYELINGVILYGTTRVSAEKIELWPEKPLGANPSKAFRGRGEASGNVVVKNGSFLLRCFKFTFNWNSKSGKSLQPKIVIPDLKVDADEGDYSSGILTFKNASVEQTGPLSALGLRAKTLEIKPNDYIWAHHGGIYSGHHLIFGFDQHRVSLKSQLTGFHAPYPSYSSQYGFGLTFNSAFRVAEKTNFDLGLGSAQRALPYYTLEFNHAMEGDSGRTLYAPRTVFDNRFSNSYFDDIESETPANEFQNSGATRNRFGIGSFWNEEPSDRITTSSYFAPIQVQYEAGRGFGNASLLADFVVQDISLVSQKAAVRTVGLQTLDLKPMNLARNLELVNQFNMAEYVGSSHYGWLRALSGAAWSPDPVFRLSVGVYDSLTTGQPQFPMDQLYSSSGGMLRFDAHFHSRAISVLAKYDFAKRDWYDTEITFSQVAGLYEPYLVFRTFPSTLKFGLKLRFNSILSGVMKGQAQSHAKKTSYKL